MAVPVHAEYTVASPSSSGTDCVGTKPAGTVAGDLLIAFIGWDLTQLQATGSTTGSPSTVPSGWTELHAGTVRTAGGDSSGYLYWKIAGGSEPANYTWAFPNSGGWGTITIHRITGAHATTPINGSSVAFTASGATSITLGSVTTTAADCLLLAFVESDESLDSGLADGTYFADPMITGWTQIDRAAWVGNSTSDDFVVLGIASSSQASPGATGTKVASITTLNDALVGYLVAVAPAAGGATNHAVAATGTLSTSAGTAAIAATRVLAPSGTLTTAGTATIAATLPMAASGTLTTAGTADPRVLQYLAPSGTLTTAGTATIAATQVLAPSGTLTTAGTAAIAAELVLAPSGTLTTAGTADLVVVGPDGTTWPVAASGTLTTAGTAALLQTLAVPATGTLATAGTATIAQTMVLTASGTLTTAGTAVFVSEVGTGVPPFYIRGVSVGGSGSSRGTPAAKRVGRVRVGG